MLRFASKYSSPSLLNGAILLILIKLSNVLSITISSKNSVYCAPALCEFYNGTHILQIPNIGCNNNGSFGAHCGPNPKLVNMSERRRLLLLDMHNLVRSKVASGQVPGYKAAARMPILKWDAELAHMASQHAKRCEFTHDDCRNTPRFKISGQNIAYFWIGREFKSHSRRMKLFVIKWFREYKDANQSYIDNYQQHPAGKKIGHFTILVADRVHRVGCAGVRFLQPTTNRYQFLLTCNYDYNNIYYEPVYETGPVVSKCAYRISEKYPDLCEWQNTIDDSEESDDNNTMNYNILI